LFPGSGQIPSSSSHQISVPNNTKILLCVNRCSLGESYHFFGETCCLCRQGKVLLPLQCWYQVPARPGILIPSAPQVVASQKILNYTSAAIKSSDLHTIRPTQPLPDLAIVTFRNFGVNLT